MASVVKIKSWDTTVVISESGGWLVLKIKYINFWNLVLQVSASTELHGSVSRKL